MEVGPTCHYVMGGVEVDADTEAAVVPGLFAVGEVSGGMHGSNRLGGNSLSDLLVFGRRAGAGAAEYLQALGDRRPTVKDDEIDRAAAVALAPFSAGEQAGVDASTENPYPVHAELQQTWNDLVGIIRRESEMQEALERLKVLRERASRVVVEGHRRYNPGWNLALDLRNMLDVAECVARAALERQESRGGHTREDFPAMDPEWRRVNLVCRKGSDGIELSRQPSIAIDPALLALFERSELEKYLTPEELTMLDGEHARSDAEPAAGTATALEPDGTEDPA
jgi:succinate dehydrogenase / fumarate reductase flavoprotein subunit